MYLHPFIICLRGISQQFFWYFYVRINFPIIVHLLDDSFIMLLLIFHILRLSPKTNYSELSFTFRSFLCSLFLEIQIDPNLYLSANFFNLNFCVTFKITKDVIILVKLYYFLLLFMLHFLYQLIQINKRRKTLAFIG